MGERIGLKLLWSGPVRTNLDDCYSWFWEEDSHHVRFATEHSYARSENGAERIGVATQIRVWLLFVDCFYVIKIIPI